METDTELVLLVIFRCLEVEIRTREVFLHSWLVVEVSKSQLESKSWSWRNKTSIAQ